MFASACAHTVSADGLGASQREALNACLVEAGIVRPMNTCSEESIWDQLSRLEQRRCRQDDECWVTFELSAPDRWGWFSLHHELTADFQDMVRDNCALQCGVTSEKPTARCRAGRCVVEGTQPIAVPDGFRCPGAERQGR